MEPPATTRAEGIVTALDTIAARLPVVFPVHPRTRARVASSRTSSNGLVLTEPLGYLDFLSLTSHARIVLTDSGGLQEETTALGIPCLTLRENTERPVTVTHGTNELVGASHERILAGFDRALSRTAPATRPELWDGRTAERIAHAVRRFLGI
jgi:UDP-N-acetylglucosamine 2-epimerase (non-hydrolysing)